MANTLNELFKEYFVIGIGLKGKDLIKYELINKYRSRVSQRLKQEQDVLRKQAEINFGEYVKDMIPRTSLLQQIPKEQFTGGSFAFPVVLGKEHGVTWPSKK